MKAKKLIALFMSAAMVIGGASLMAACGDDDADTKKPGGEYAHTDDTRIWYAVGDDSKGTAKVNGWEPQTINNEMKFVRDTTVTSENVFTLSLDIYAGDKGAGYGFKFLFKTSENETISDDELWPRQIGIHNFEGVEGEAEAAVLKSGATTVFTTDSGANANNLYLAKGQEGTYKFTLKTFPDGKGGDAKAPVLTFERTKVIEVTHDMWIYGDINNFGWGPTADKYPMAEKVEGENITWSTQIAVTEADLVRNSEGALVDEGATGEFAAVQVYNKVEKDGKHATFVAEESGYKVVEVETDDYTADFMLLPKGNYTITFNQKTSAVTIKAGTHEMYLIGGWYAEEGTDNYGWGYEEGFKAFPLTQKDDIWTRVQWFDGATELKLYNALTGAYYTTPENVSTDANIKILEAGNYAFRFDQSTNTVEFEKIEYYLVGTFVDDKGEAVNFSDKGIIAGLHPKFEKVGDNYVATVTATDVTGMDNYKWMVEQGKGGVFGVQIVAGATFKEINNKDGGNSNGVYEWGVADSGNNIFLQAGTWTITIDTSDWHFTVTAAE